MNDRFQLLHLPTRWSRRLAAASLDLARRGVALGLIWLLVPLTIAPLPAFGQQQVPPPPPPDQQQGAPPPQQGAPPPQDQDQQEPPYNALNPDQLNELVAPIALYPDSLVAQVLAASTYPTQIVDADRFVQANQGAPPDQLAQMVDGQPWDPSVKALTAFPSVLSNMDRNLDWTTNLGNAYYNQPQDVMDAIQAMRQQAYQRGDLRTTPQEVVNDEASGIEIAPSNPDVVYVPYYNPWTVWGFQPWYVYYMPPRPAGLFFVGGLALGFGLGIGMGAWSHLGWGWGHWGMGWGPHPYLMHDRREFVPYRRGEYGRFDRHPGARDFNRQVAEHARANGYSHGYAAGQRNGYNRGARNTYRAPVTRPENRQNYNRSQGRPAQNYNRPAQNYNRPQPQRQSRPQPQRQSRPQPQRQSRPAHNNSHPKGNSKPHGGGGHSHGH